MTRFFVQINVGSQRIKKMQMLIIIRANYTYALYYKRGPPHNSVDPCILQLIELLFVPLDSPVLNFEPYQPLSKQPHQCHYHLNVLKLQLPILMNEIVVAQEMT